MPAAEVAHSASYRPSSATARQSIICGGKNIWRIWPNARVPKPLQKQRVKPEHQNSQLCKLYEQKGRDFKQDLSVFHGGDYGTASCRRSESYGPRYKIISARFHQFNWVGRQSSMPLLRFNGWLILYRDRFPSQYVRIRRCPSASESWDWP